MNASIAPAQQAPAGAEVVIDVRDLETTISGELIHDHLRLQVFRGEIVGVVGASGSGKSVFLREIMGLHRPQSGKITVLGHEIAPNPSEEDRELRSRWGVLFQEGGLFSTLTVAENIEVPLRELTALPKAMLDQIVRVKLAMVGLEQDNATKFPAELSGGMERRAGLARAIATDPELLILDEPTSGLDPIAAGHFDELIASLRKGLNLTVILATHDLDTLQAICDRVAVLVEHSIIAGTVDEIRENPNPWIQKFFSGPRGRSGPKIPGKPTNASTLKALAEPSARP